MRFHVGLGANLGDAQLTIKEAIRRLAMLPGVTLLRASHCYRSAPVDASGPDFINAVVELSCEADPLQLLDMLLELEAEFGRARPYVNAPRTLDLDILLADDLTWSSARLSIPHPRLGARAFALAPLIELDPDAMIPGQGRARQLLAKVRDQRIERIA